MKASPFKVLLWHALARRPAPWQTIAKLHPPVTLWPSWSSLNPRTRFGADGGRRPVSKHCHPDTPPRTPWCAAPHIQPVTPWTSWPSLHNTHTLTSSSSLPMFSMASAWPHTRRWGASSPGQPGRQYQLSGAQATPGSGCEGSITREGAMRGAPGSPRMGGKKSRNESRESKAAFAWFARHPACETDGADTARTDGERVSSPTGHFPYPPTRQPGPAASPLSGVQNGL
jgi:hypothetical protein